MKIRYYFAAVLILAFTGALNILATVSPQHTENTKNTPDQTLRSNARINPSTLALEFSIPIADFPGRAGMNMPLVFNYSSKLWRFELIGGGQTPIANYTTNVPRYAEKSAAGWTSSFGTAQIESYEETYDCNGNPLGEAPVRIPPPYSQGQYPNGEEPPPGNCGNGIFYMNRLRVKLPDGSSIELRKDDAIHDHALEPVDWTGSYLATDGSRTRMELTASGGILYLPDGSRYHFGSDHIGNLYEDRHGNRISFNSTTRTWIDTLGRSFISPLPLNLAAQEQTAGTQSFSIPGLTGTSQRQYQLIWKNLGDTGVLLDPTEQLTYAGNQLCPATTSNGGGLFIGGLETRICESEFFNPVVLRELILPNGSKYKFQYNRYGEITKIEYPTGASEKFEFGQVPTLSYRRDFVQDASNRGVLKRWVKENPNATELYWKYEPIKETNRLRIRTTAPDNQTITEQYIESNWSHDFPNTKTKWGFDNPAAGRPYDERVYSGTTLRSRKLTEYETSGPLPGGVASATRDARVKQQISVVFEPANPDWALVTLNVNTYDTNGSPDLRAFSAMNLKSSVQYGYILVPAESAKSETIGQLAYRFNGITPELKTETDYKYDTPNVPQYVSATNSVLGLVSEVRTIKPSTNTVVARSQIDYDEGLYVEGATVTTAPGWLNRNNIYKGLPTTSRNWSDVAANQYITTHVSYDQFGNPKKNWDGRGNFSEIQYTDNYADGNNSRDTYALPTKTISYSGANGTGTVFESSVKYDFNTGLPRFVTDPNNQTLETKYEDPLLRPTKVIAPNGQQTITEYGTPDTNGQLPANQRFLKVKTQIDETKWNEGYTWFDGLGRTVRSQSVASDGDVFVDTQYDIMGRPWKTTNPYRNGETVYETENFYDEIGRPVKVKTPDQAEVETFYSLATSGQNIGTVVTVEDQANKQRRSITNALGQLTRVDEPDVNNGNQLGAIDAPLQPTYYDYDALSNLTKVRQGGTYANPQQQRTFAYDNLSRLLTANNPESGAISYVYDANGNLTQKTDARQVVANYSYDALNRVTSRSYANEPSGQRTTLPVTYVYENNAIAYSKGKLTKVITGNVNSPFAVTEYQEFDSMGRVKRSQQTTDGTAYNPMEYTYNLSGALVEQKYPSGRVVKNTLDNDGDLSIVQSRRNQNAGLVAYAKHFTYTAAGAVSSMQFGNGAWESTVFNSRLQPTQIALGSVQNGTNKLKLDFTYNTTTNGTPNADNNGNVLSQTITTPSETRLGVTYSAFTAVQTYQYDALNRIKEAEEKIGTNQQWKQTFIYDRYGNRTFDEGSVSGQYKTTTLPRNCGTAPNLVCAKDNPHAIASNNKLQGIEYDSAGNTRTDLDNRRFTYDGENKQIKVETTDGSGNVTGTLGEYFYDGDGKRVKKVSFESSQWITTIFVYEASGKMVAEYSTQTSTTPQVSYLTNDHLGSPRVNTDAVGNVTARHDYQPFGEEVQRASHGTDQIRQKFTSYERDNESGLDYAQARYYSNQHGRFTLVDPIMMTKKRLRDPQSINLYSYSRNNPLKYVDPTGEYFVGANGKRVGFKIDDKGKIVLGKNASADLVRMAKLINKAGSEIARAQFAESATNETKNHFKIVKGEKNNDLLGLHQAHDKNGKPLKWEAGAEGTGKFDGQPAYIKDKDGNMVYKEVTITVFEGNIKNDIDNIRSSYGDPKITSDEAMVGTFTHETDHNTNQEAIDAIRDRHEGRPNDLDVEKPAEEIEEQTYDEIRRNRKP
ncbi:MAG: hypothetical protein LUM44_22355 [Pyrinomonadaceae bacterium]|nr:hypothetical protein [Pyrinomonadaceae bacterium]